MHDVCEGLCGERHQEDPPMDYVALFDEHMFAKEVAYVVVSTTH